MGVFLKEAVAMLARNFIWEGENWENYVHSKTSSSVAWPPEFLLLAQAVEVVYGAPPIEDDFGEGPTGCADDNTALSRAVGELGEKGVSRVLKEIFGQSPAPLPVAARLAEDLKAVREALESIICGHCQNRIGYTGPTRYSQYENCAGCKRARAALEGIKHAK